MITSLIDAKQNFAALLDDAQRGPVVIRRQSRDQAVVISPQEYARLRGLAVADFQEFCDRVGREAVERGLTERKLEALLRDDANGTVRRRAVGASETHHVTMRPYSRASAA